MSMVDVCASFGENVAVTTTAVLPDYMDLSASRDVATGYPEYIEVYIGEDFAGGTSVNFEAVTADNENFTGAEVIGSTGVIPVADLAVNKPSKRLALQPNQVSLTGRRYLGLRATVAGTMTAGKVSAYIGPGGNDEGRQLSYPTANASYGG